MWEKLDWQKFPGDPIIGVDEVGRGCLAGPVYACAVVLDTNVDFDSYTDSKAISEKRRKILSQHILAHHQVGIGFATVEEIDEINILNASLLAMKRAVQSLGFKSGHILVDGNIAIPGLENFEQTTIVKGDLRASPIAAASIVAKVTRDELIGEMENVYPGYQFYKHKGYATQLHRSVIAERGPCPLHRKTFKGVKEYL